MNYRIALIVGAGSGLSASLARAFTKAGMSVALAARSAAKLDEFVQATGCKAFNCDAAKREEVDRLFADLDAARHDARRRRLQRQLPHARAVRGA